MWTLKSSIPYPSIPVAVTTRTDANPTSQQMLRWMGQWMPRRWTTRTPQPYNTSRISTINGSTGMGWGCQASTRSSVGGSLGIHMGPVIAITIDVDLGADVGTEVGM